MADITVDVNLPSTISVDVTSPTQVLATNISIPGPQGPAGIQGPSGAIGPSGATGPSGIVNMEYSILDTILLLILVDLFLVICLFMQQQ